MTAVDENPGVVWFRRDLRLVDNPAWAEATASHQQVVALFVLEPRLLRSAGNRRRDQLFAHLLELDAELQALGGGLVVRSGPAQRALPDLVNQCEASAVYVNADVSAFSQQRDAAVAAALSVPLRSAHGGTVHAPGTVLTKKGTLSQVFSAFHKAWRATPFTPWPAPGGGQPIVLPGEPIPEPADEPRQPGGAAAAEARLMAWLARVDDYPETRDLPAIDGTSDLSADLKFGAVSARTVLDVVGESTPGRAAFVRQLAWRDWWAHMLAARPDLPVEPVRPEYGGIEWINDPDDFGRWCAGQTGYPIVDAGMRQLTTIGWMHNRVRMICASFLVKDLLIDWRWGERFFRHHLVDADVAQNAGNWQWVAGTGPDAAPYFRVFNPTAQSAKFDPDGSYIRRWVPELANLSGEAIHEPGRASTAVLATAGVVLGDSYPNPMVDHADARLRALETYRQARSS